MVATFENDVVLNNLEVMLAHDSFRQFKDLLRHYGISRNYLLMIPSGGSVKLNITVFERLALSDERGNEVEVIGAKADKLLMFRSDRILRGQTWVLVVDPSNRSRWSKALQVIADVPYK